MLTVTIRECAFYTLFADGGHTRKITNLKTDTTRLYYTEGSVIFLYYTYPNYREALCIRAMSNTVNSNIVTPPSVSGKARLLFSLSASKVDKLKRAVSFLREHSSGAFQFTDQFYTRLYFIISQKG